MSKWKKEKPIEGGHGSCLHCGYQYEELPISDDFRITVGFGYSGLSKNGIQVWADGAVKNYDDAMSSKQAEEIAARDPENDWRIHMEGPLSERHWQRQGVGKWVLYKKGEGFA